MKALPTVHQPPGKFAEVNWLAIAMLVLSAANPRQHPKKQLRQIAKSITRFGFLVPVLIDADNNVICGHGRVLAAQLLGMTEVPVIRITHLSAADIKAYQIADNQLTLNATWDRELLRSALVDLCYVDVNFDFDALGFSMGEVDVIIEGVPSSERDKADEIPTIAKGPPVTKLGDLWLLDSHRMLCGNSTVPESYEKLMGNRTAGMIFSDPPYNVRIQGHVGGLGKIKHSEFAMASGEMSDEEFQCFLLSFSRQLVRFSRDGSMHFFFMDWRHFNDLLAVGHSVYTELKNVCVWVKDNGGMGSLYRSQHELVAVYKNGRAPHINNVELGKNGRNRTNVWNYPSANTFSKSSDEGRLNELHPTVKPVMLVADAILDCSNRGDIVLDPFLGSGTTLMAAERVGRICFGLELSPEYVDVIIRRWQRWTGGQAIHAETGKTFHQIESELQASEASNA